MFLKYKSIIFKIRRSKVTDYAALMRQFFEYPKHMLWLTNGKNSLNLEAREVHIYRTGKTTTKPAKTTTGIYIRIPSDGLLMPLPDESHRADRLI